MYLITGGAGFIGSNIVAYLADRGDPVVVCDWMRSDHRWKNLAKHEVTDVISPNGLTSWLDKNRGEIKAIIHLGAISATNEENVDLLVQNNVRLTLDLLDWCAESQTRIIYASSAATYGDGSQGFDDEFTPEALAKLRPLNAYGWSKHLIDQRFARSVERGRRQAPQCVGLKFFNVYGPNEYHKGSMQSVIAQSFQKVLANEPLRLFRSYRSDYADGCQLRDFVYVKDVVLLIDWLLDHERISGIFNVGSGKARSWLDLSNALFAAVNRSPRVEYIDMPAPLIDKYQYFTEAKMERLRNAGFAAQFTSLEDGILVYVRDFLSRQDRYN